MRSPAARGARPTEAERRDCLTRVSRDNRDGGDTVGDGDAAAADQAHAGGAPVFTMF
jgi:hypothetical protein